MSEENGDPAGANSAAIQAAVVEAVADEYGIGVRELAAVITVVGADLTDSHHEYELEYEHATVDDTRIYAVTDDEWARVIERNDASDLAEPLRVAHRKQAEQLVNQPPESPLVAGIDTAEEPDQVPQQYGN